MIFWAKTTADGKPGVSVYQHMLNVGNVACCIAALAPSLLKRFHLRSAEVGALAALHDIGKISPGFQRKCKAWLEENNLSETDKRYRWDSEMESDHGKVSHSALQEFLNDQKVPRKSGVYISSILGGHHGRLNRPEDRGYRPSKAIAETASGIDWDKERRRLAEKIWKTFSADSVGIDLTEKDPALWWLAGLTSVADWIGSDENLFSPEPQAEEIEPATVAEAALAKIGFGRPEIRPGMTFEELFGFPANEMQKRTMAAITEPGVYVIEAPMGMGKTEAALGAAYQVMAAGKASGIYFALPTQATSNRIHLRMNTFVQRISPDESASRLIHGNSWLMDLKLAISPSKTDNNRNAEDARTGRDWFASSKRSLIAPFGVGTVDQGLLAVVAAKHFFVRRFALAGKVVILDEVHSYDLYTGTLIDKLIETLEGLGCTVIVLSATLTGQRRDQITSLGDYISSIADELPYPLITGRREGEVISPVDAKPPESRAVSIQFTSTGCAEAEAVRLSEKGGAVLWICDTVDAAQRQYRILSGLQNPCFKTGLLHSRFPFWRREVLEGEWMARLDKSGKTRCGSILVSTQIVEQSVDLDADLMVTELAPTDMLLQRLGRLWRHDRPNRPVDSARLLIIDESSALDELKTMDAKAIREALGNKAFVYAPYVLLRTLEVWKNQGQVSIPSEIRSMIEATYRERSDDPAAWTELREKMTSDAVTYRQQALQNSNIWSPGLPDEEGIQTRLNEMPTVSVVLCRAISRTEVNFIDGTRETMGDDAFRLSTAQAIHRNIVKVPLYCFGNIEPCSAFSRYLHGLQTVGIVSDTGEVTLSGLKDNKRLYYSDDLGLVIDKTSAKEEI